MAKLFGKEYHVLSSSWYFKESLKPLDKGALTYSVVKSHRGDVIFKFYSAPGSLDFDNCEMVILYEPKKQEIISYYCSCCSTTKKKKNNQSCSHYLSVIDYCSKYLTTDIIKSIKTTIYHDSFLAYNEYWQSEAVKGKIYIENIYDKGDKRIKFFFQGYDEIDLITISRLVSEKKYVTGYPIINQQKEALTDAELSLLGLLQNIKTSLSSVKNYWAIEATDFVQCFPVLRVLSDMGLVYIKETGERLIFSDEQYNLSLQLNKTDLPYIDTIGGKELPIGKDSSYLYEADFADSITKYLNDPRIFQDGESFRGSDKYKTLPSNRKTQNTYILKPSPGCFYSACYVGTVTYLFVENIVYSIRLPFYRQIVEKIFAKGLFCRENDLIYLAAVVAKQLGSIGCYIDFEESISIPKHHISQPQIIFDLEKLRDDIGVKVSLSLDYGERQLPYTDALYESNLIEYEVEPGSKEWFFIPYDINRQIIDFLRYLPQADENLLRTDSFCIYHTESKIDEIKRVFYEKARSEWIINLDDELKNQFIHKVDLSPIITINKGDHIDWFDYKIEYQVKGKLFTHQEIKEFFSSTRKYLKLPDGKQIIFSNRDTFDRIEDQLSSMKKYGTSTKGNRLSHYNLSFLYTLAQYDDRIKIMGDSYLQKMYVDLLRRRLESGDDIPLSLYNVMRGYQKIGYRWMKMLQEYHLGGVLADDMGLGKTLQAIAILTDYYANKRDISGKEVRHLPSLVICPKTLIYNWANEIEKFHTDISYSIYEGTREERQKLLTGGVYDYDYRQQTSVQQVVSFDFADDYDSQVELPNEHISDEEQQLVKRNPISDVIIVSYALVNYDYSLFEKYHFAYVILDEAQHIKNPNTLRTCAVKNLKCDYRLALTGTPLENNLIELWSIYDFLMPGYLHTLPKFKKHYVKSVIEDMTDNDSQQHETPATEDKTIYAKSISLQEIISPFILRRKKSDVLMELPDKQEQILMCNLTPQQEKLYVKIIAMAKQEFFPSSNVSDDQAGDAITPQVYINVLAALMRLRQICNHPGLVKKELLKKPGVSGKLELLSELIDDAVENQRNLLIFSQFVTMLKKIADMLNHKGIVYEYMDGATRNRQERINNFCTNDKVQIFLLTLKVGGLGLNLTKADTVILVDPWWNPMVEDQSIDRAHRIGQTKKVMVYKIITRGTLEEKIIQLQQHKRDIFKSVIENSQNVIKKLTLTEIKKLFDYDGDF